MAQYGEAQRSKTRAPATQELRTTDRPRQKDTRARDAHSRWRRRGCCFDGTAAFRTRSVYPPKPRPVVAPSAARRPRIRRAEPRAAAATRRRPTQQLREAAAPSCRAARRHRDAMTQRLRARRQDVLLGRALHEGPRALRLVPALLRDSRTPPEVREEGRRRLDGRLRQFSTQ